LIIGLWAAAAQRNNTRAAQTLDLTSHVPVSGARYVLISLDSMVFSRRRMARLFRTKVCWRFPTFLLRRPAISGWRP
jgi:hypothetical protein